MLVSNMMSSARVEALHDAGDANHRHQQGNDTDVEQDGGGNDEADVGRLVLTDNGDDAAC
jgi:hypothetical protein